MTRVLTDDILDAARELQGVRDQLGRMKKNEQQLRERILGALDDDDIGLTASGSRAVHVETQHRRGVNRTKLEAMFPEVFDAVMEESEVKVLKIDLEVTVTL